MRNLLRRAVKAKAGERRILATCMGRKASGTGPGKGGGRDPEVARDPPRTSSTAMAAGNLF